MKKYIQLILLTVLLFAGSTTQAQRNPLKWPFAKTSIWNTPIHNNAVYAPADVQDAVNFEVDEDVVIMTPDAPLMAVKTNNTGWGAGGAARCSDQGPVLFSAPIPQSFIFSNEIWAGNTPNSGAAILLQNGKIKQTQPFAKCSPTLSTSLYVWDENGCDLKGECIVGAHGGSHLSAVGGTLRVGELSAGIIKHVLKINLFGKENFYKGNGGFRWPASTADGGYDDVNSGNYYGGSNPEMRIGALLAIPKTAVLESVSNNSLGLETEAALIIARALQNYGAYTVDNTAWDTYGLITEIGPDGRVSNEFKSLYGYDMNFYGNPNTAWARDIKKLYTSLNVITNNDPDNIGGGPNADVVHRRAPQAPEFLPEQAFKILPIGDSKTAGGGVGGQSSWRGYLRTKLIRQGYKLDYVGPQNNFAPGDTIPYDYDNAGFGGYTIGPDINRFCPSCETTGIFEHVQDYLPAANPDIILLAIGVNDMFGAELHPPNYAKTAPQRYKDLVYKIQQLKPSAKIIVGTIEPVKWDVNWGSNPGDESLGALNAAIKALADSSTTDNIYFADIRNKMLVNYGPADFFDDLHLSETGAEKDARAWFDAIVPVLNNTPNNVAPTVAITSPADSAAFDAPANITINVNATDTDGEVTKVEFYNGEEKIGENSTAPFSFTWNSVDDLFAQTTSASVLVTVNSTDNYVKFQGTPIGSPGSWANGGATFDKALDSNLATFFDAPVADGQWIGLDLGQDQVVRKIRFSPRATWAQRLVGAKIQGATTANFSDAVDLYTIDKKPAEGIYTTKRIPNGDGYRYYRILSPPNGYGNVAEIEFWGILNAAPNIRPTVKLTTPFKDATYHTLANVGLSAEASDSDGTVTKVDFLSGGNVIGTVTSAPYIFIWDSVPEGAYTIQARATDNFGSTKLSEPANIWVSQNTGSKLYTEDFNNNTSDGWVSNGGAWGASNQKLESTDWNGSFTSVYTIASFSNYTYEVDAVAIWNNDIGFVFNYVDANNFYRLDINTNSKSATLIKVVNGNSSNISTGTFTGNGSGSSHNISIYNNGTNTTVKINGGIVFDNISTTEFAGGKIGLYAFYCPSNFDNILVTSNNKLPSVAFLSPASGSVYNPGASILFSSEASDTDGSVTELALYHEDVLIATATQAPYNITWSNAPAGIYNVSAVATDNGGGKRTSSALRIIVGTPLALDLVSFTGRNSDNGNVLKWTTQREVNAAYFEVERSTDGRNFSSIGSQKATGAGTGAQTYYFTDKSPLHGDNYYRLRYYDQNNAFKLSNIVILGSEGRNGVQVYPNPVVNQIFASVYSRKKVQAQLTVYDMAGKALLFKSVLVQEGKTIVPLTLGNLPSGSYVLTTTLDGSILHTRFNKL
jgi:lysophospholipase L1-like esterase